MILDKQLVFSDAQAVTASAASEHTIDLGAANLELGVGTPLYIEVWMDTVFSGSTATLTVDLQDGAAVGGSDKVMEILPAISQTAMIAKGIGLLAKVMLPVGMDISRHLRLYYTASASLAGGKLNAFITIG